MIVAEELTIEEQLAEAVATIEALKKELVLNKNKAELENSTLHARVKILTLDNEHYEKLLKGATQATDEVKDESN